MAKKEAPVEQQPVQKSSSVWPAVLVIAAVVIVAIILVVVIGSAN